MKRVSLRFGKYSKDGSYMLLHLTGSLKDGKMYSLIEGLTQKQARNIIARLTKDLEMIR